MDLDIQGVYKYLLLEGYLIFLFFLQGPDASIDYLTDYFPKIEQSFSHIFLVKLASFLYKADKKEQAAQIILSVYYQYKKTISHLNGEGLRFCLYLAYILKELKCETELITLIKALYYRYEKSQDELSKIECLALVKEYTEFHILWDSLISNSLYLTVTQKFILNTQSHLLFPSVTQLLNFLKG